MTETTQRGLGFAAWIALLALQVLWHGWWQPPAAMTQVAAIILSAVPFAIPLVYWGRWERALLVAGVLSLFYFAHGIAVAYAAPGQRTFAVCESVLAVLVILACARMPKRRTTARSNPR